jgi:hypothetical protein
MTTGQLGFVLLALSEFDIRWLRLPSQSRSRLVSAK